MKKSFFFALNTNHPHNQLALAYRDFNNKWKTTTGCLCPLCIQRWWTNHETKLTIRDLMYTNKSVVKNSCHFVL